LWAFNEEVVARAIRSCGIPVVVGVGHESDFTIADFAADLRAATPTAAAEVVAPDRAGLLDTVGQHVRALQRHVRRRCETAQQRLDFALRTLAAPRAPLRGLDARLDWLQARLVALRRARSAAWQRSVTHGIQALGRVRPQLPGYELRLRAVQTSFSSHCRRGLERQIDRVAAAMHAIALLDPRAVFERGYSIVRDQAGRIVRSSSTLRDGDTIDLTFARGGAVARIENTRSD
jgi:exodeoxyribonuclease VII large subunit